MSATQRGQLVALASLALRPGHKPCWPSKPAATWLLEAALLFTWPTGLESASRDSSLPWPPLAEDWRVSHLASMLTSSPSSEVFALSCVDTANLQLATSAAIYKELTCTPHPPGGAGQRGSALASHLAEAAGSIPGGCGG